MKPARMLAILLALLLTSLLTTACSQPALPESSAPPESFAIPANSTEPTPAMATPTLPPLPTGDGSLTHSTTPDGADACVTAFLTALARNDAGAMMDTTMLDELCDYLTDSYGNRFAGNALGLANMRTPMRHINEFICSLLSNVDLTLTNTDFTKDQVNSFIASVDPARFSRLEIVALATGRIAPDQTAQAQKSMSALGISDLAIRYALISVEGVHFFQQFFVGRYGDDYRIIDIGLPNEQGYGTGLAQYTTKDDFLSLFTEESISSLPLLPNALGSSDVYDNIKNITVPTLPSPHDAVLFCTDAFARQDFYAALSATSFYHQANTYSLAAMAEYIHMFPPSPLNLPPEQAFYADLNLVTTASEKAELLYRIRMGFALDFNNLPEDTAPEVIIPLINNSDEDILTLTVKRSDVIAQTQAEDYQQLINRHQVLYAADELVYRIVEFSTKEKNMVSAFSILRIGNEWRILNDESVFFDVSSYLPVVPADTVDYDSLV